MRITINITIDDTPAARRDTQGARNNARHGRDQHTNERAFTRAIVGAALHRYGDVFATVLFVALRLKLRLKETLALRPTDIDLTAGEVTIRGGKVPDRVVSVPRDVIPALAYLADSASDEPLLRGRDGRAMSLKTFHHRWGVICRQAGVGPVRFHDVRANRMSNPAPEGR